MHMRDNINIIGLVAVAGAFMMILSVFLEWGTMSVSTFWNSGSITGWELFQGIRVMGPTGMPETVDLTDYDYSAAVMLAAGVVGFLAAAFSLSPLSRTVRSAAYAVSMVVSLVSVVVAVLLYQSLIGSSYGWIEPSYGLWVGVAGGILSIIGFIALTARKDPDPNAGIDQGMVP